jgi:hypothetical protein
MAATIVQAQLERLKCFVYHEDIPDDIAKKMIEVRQFYLNLAGYLLVELPESRSKSICLTHLEESNTRAIQALALQGKPDVEFL